MDTSSGDRLEGAVVRVLIYAVLSFHPTESGAVISRHTDWLLFRD